MATSANRDPPTTLAYCVATAILAALGGYFVGQASNLGLFSDNTRQRPRSSSFADLKEAAGVQPNEPGIISAQKVDEVKSAQEEELEDSDDDEQQDLSGFEDAGNEECKLVLVVRTDLGMTKGKTSTLSVMTSYQN